MKKIIAGLAVIAACVLLASYFHNSANAASPLNQGTSWKKQSDCTDYTGSLYSGCTNSLGILCIYNGTLCVSQATGSQGPTGTGWHHFTSTPTTTYQNGDFAYSSSTGSVYIQSAGTWSYLYNQTGPTGSTGATGTAATISSVSVSAIASGGTPTVVNNGTESDAQFVFSLPTATPGTNGTDGAGFEAKVAGVPGCVDYPNTDATYTVSECGANTASAATYSIYKPSSMPTISQSMIVTNVSGSNVTMGWGESGSGLSDPGADGMVYRNGLNTTTTASYPNIVAQFGGGTCSGYLKNDGTCDTPSGTYAPTGTVISSAKTFTTSEMAGQSHWVTTGNYGLTLPIITNSIIGYLDSATTSSIPFFPPNDGTTLHAGSTALNAGDAVYVIGDYAMTKIIGTASNTAYLFTSGTFSAGGPSYSYSLSQSSPFSLGSITVDSTGTGTVVVTNTGLNFLNPTFSAATGTPISIVNDSCSSQTIASGATCTFGIQFAPHSAATYTDVLTLAFSRIATSGTFTAWGTGVSGGSCAYDACETFDATGYDLASWAETLDTGGTVNEDYTTSPAPLSGTQSLYMATTDYYLSYATYTFTAADNAYFTLLSRVTGSGTDNQHTIEILDASNNVLAHVQRNFNGTLLEVGNGTQTCYASSGAMLFDTTRRMWLEYEAGTGANGVTRLYLSDNGTKPSSAGFPSTDGCIVSAGTSTAQAASIRFRTSYQFTWMIDDLFRDATAIGNQ